MTPREQAAYDSDPLYVPVHDIERRIVSVEYTTLDYGNTTTCTLAFDNGIYVVTRVSRVRDEIAETMAYNAAIIEARPMFQWMLAEHQLWQQSQAEQETMLATLGHTGGE